MTRDRHIPKTNPSPDATPSRRQFLERSAIAAGAIAGTLAAAAPVHAAGSDKLRVALVGCGGRGRGAALNSMRADPNVELVALADVFEDQLRAGRDVIRNTMAGEGMSAKFAVTDENCFTGFDAYKHVCQKGNGIDIVLLATPPHFRPEQLKAAIEGGKHVFCEKPVAVDAPGVRSVLETTAAAKKKNLSIVSGLCWRYDYGVRETIKRVKDGAIGDIVAIQENYLTGTLWSRPRKPNWTEMEYQLRNWLYYTWLSGDHNVEQHIHSLDKAVWLNDDEPPVSCYGMGGRQVRTAEIFGNIYDHHAVCYEFPGSVMCYAFTRQMGGCHGDTEDYVLGSKGRARILAHSITGENTWAYPRAERRSKPSMYDVEHKEMLEGLRSGKIINNGHYMSVSTMMAIMGRMATYTGQRVTWKHALSSQEKLGPDKYEWGDLPRPPVAMPGFTKLT